MLSGASVGNTVGALGTPYTTLRGDLGVKADAQPTGFPPGLVTGAIQVGNPLAAEAHADLVAAYSEVAARTGGVALPGALVGEVLPPGLYAIAGAASNTGTLTLDGGGNPDAVFVFQVNGAMTMATGSHVVLTNGARASRVFWQVNGAAAIGANAEFAGTVMALDAIAVGNSSMVNGRALARNGAVSLDANDFYSVPPVVTIVGGVAAVTADMTPTISGTTDIEPPAFVTVTIDGQSLTDTPSDGTWSVTSAMLVNGAYPVVVSVSDGAGNPGSATQQLTVDTAPPVTTIDGGPSAATNDATPTIAGTSDAVPDTFVRVTVASQSLAAVVQVGGTWNVTPAALDDGTYTITASVSDAAGNLGVDSQLLRVDTLGALAITSASLTGMATLNRTTGRVGTLLRATVTWSRETVATYQWFRGGAPILGATAADYTVTRVDLGNPVWLTASAAETARTVQVSSGRLTPRTTTWLAVTAAKTRILAGRSMRLRGTIRSAAAPARRNVKIQLRQKVGRRWVLRRTRNAVTNVAGAFAISYRVPVARTGRWRATAVFSGTAAMRPKTSRPATWTVT